MSPTTNTFFDINQLPNEEGILLFGISMSRISNRQSAENCFLDLQRIDTKIRKTKGIGMVVWYGDYLYFHSDEKAYILRDRYKNLMLSHKNAFMNIIENKPEWTSKAFSFMSFGQIMLDNSAIFQNAFQTVSTLYKNDPLFQNYVHDDCARITVDFDDRNVQFILEEITTFYLASKGLLQFNNTFTNNNHEWILQGYPGKPLKSEVYLFQNNPLHISYPRNKFEYCYYDLESKLLYDFNRLDIDTFDFGETNDVVIDTEQERENLENVSITNHLTLGMCLTARRAFTAGECVFTVIGDTITYHTDYSIPINEHLSVEPRISRSVAQYLNHSCSPNTYPNQDGRSYLAMHDIAPGTEITTNYAFLGHRFGTEMTVDGTAPIQLDLTCRCGSNNCTGTIRAYDDLTPSEKDIYNNYVLPFLKKN